MLAAQLCWLYTSTLWFLEEVYSNSLGRQLDTQSGMSQSRLGEVCSSTRFPVCPLL